MDSNNLQIRSFEEVICSGYERAAASFTSLIGKQVRIDNNKTSLLTGKDRVSDSLNKSKDFLVVKTSIIGTLKGESYLLLTKEEENEICELSKKAFGGGSIGNDLILKEIDNILSAAVITELSNVLNLRMYGDVPHLIHGVDSEQLNQTIQSDNPEDDYFVLSNANFVFDGDHSVSPIFIWRFEKKIISLMEEENLKASQ